MSMQFLIREITHDSYALQQGRLIFINYFQDLYKDISPETLGVKGDVSNYLRNIFDKTEHALGDDALKACGIYLENTLVGFTTYEIVEDIQMTLIRTWPVDLAFKEEELNIRETFIQYIKNKHPNMRNILILIRKANIVHQTLCLQSEFIECDEIFEQSPFIRAAYDSTWYKGYIRNIN